MARADVIVFTISVGFLFLALFGLIAPKVYKRDNLIFHYMRRSLVLGLIGIPIAVILAFVSGDGALFLSSVFKNPLSLMGSAFSGGSEDYANTCINGKCAHTCCQALNNVNDRWKDCNDTCKSKPGTVGRVIGTDCRFSEMPFYCDGTLASGVQSGSNTISACQIDGSGSKPCTCCEDMNQSERWWDCNSSCNSHHTLFGRAADSRGSCTGLTQIQCRMMM